MLSTNEENVHLEQEQELHQQAAETLGMGELMLEGGMEEGGATTAAASVSAALETRGKKVTPAASRRDSYAGSEAATAPGTGGSAGGKRRGRPRGWTDARIHQMLAYLERNLSAYRSVPVTEFYSGLCMALGYDLGECAEIQEKCEKMVKKFDNDTRRGDISWKWYGRMNQVFGGPALPPFGGLASGRPLDDDAASSSLDSGEEDEASEPVSRRPRGEDPFQDRLQHEKLLLKLKKLKSKTEMRHRDWETAMEKQAAAFEELKGKTAHAIARLEKSIVNAGYELDQADMLEPQAQL